MKKAGALMILFFLLYTPLLALKKQYFYFNKSLAIRKLTGKENPKVNWLVIHRNEFDAAKVMRWALKKYGGTGYEVLNRRRGLQRALKHGYGRYAYLYDPNRIFTNKGIHETLIHYNRNYHRIKRRAVRFLSRKIRSIFLKYFPLSKTTYLIALHNNMNRGDISVDYFYGKKGFYIFQSPKYHEKNFVLVTRERDFKILMKQGVNVVWHYEIYKKNDDGSLSVHALQNDYAYLNIESRFGDREGQKKIVDVVMKHIIEEN